jgi:ABC-type phosphate transport system substrate-binding protein
MTTLSVRRIVSACILSGAAVAALAAPGAASAEPLGTQCSGENIQGRGSTFQGLAQGVWDPGFNLVKGKANTNLTACGGSQGGKKVIKVEYLQTNEEDKGSGACLKAFGAVKAPTLAKYGKFAFCGTDEAPSAAQRAEMESHKVGGEAETIESIPVVQGSVAVIVHLPANCTAKSEVVGATTRLVLKAQTLEGIFRGTITKWSQIKENGDAVEGSGCNPEEEIQRVVRLDKSGTTHIFKESLAEASENTKEEEAIFEAEEFGEIEVGKGDPCGSVLLAGPETWGKLASGCENERWAKGSGKPVLRPAKTGGPAVVAEVAAVASSIGYANMADARTTFGAGGGTSKFWVEVQHNFEAKKPTTLPTYADPASNGDSATVAESNCASTVYTNGKEKFPPPSTRQLWNAVRAKIKETKYPICGLTYDLVLDEGSKYTKETESALTLEGATSAVNFELWVNNGVTNGGSYLIKKHDYTALPDPIADKAEEGLKAIVF